MKHLEGIETKQLENWLQEKNWSLADLENMKARGSYNEYVTAENIDEWIAGQKAEIEAMESLIQKRKAGVL